MTIDSPGTEAIMILGDKKHRKPIPVTGGPLGSCPSCDGTEFLAVDNGEETNFWCSTCGRCWHLSLGWISLVEPATCPGCSLREQCLARQAASSAGH